ncbi:MAG TPA: TonB-dependent receptor [Sphingobacteriaceae bacterium]|nr:TonB-dependent receptor [Sphingobacteriaceae bacterium]
MKRFLLVIVFFSCCSLGMQAQNRTIKGTVRDADGPLPAASIYEKDQAGNGTLTNANGAFQLTLRGSSNILIVQFIGYLSKEVNVADRRDVSISLEPDAKGLEEVVIVGFGTSTKLNNASAVSSIPASDIRGVPTPNVQNTLAGRLPGFFSQQRSGRPGQDAADFFIRGASSLNAAGNQPLIIVDDIEYTYAQVAQIDANEIETISILKDASTTAVYGIKGANGVLVITTKRGQVGKPRVSFTTETGVQQIIDRPEFLDSYQTALLRNEALRNDGLPEQFTAQDLELFRNGQDPYGHANVNWVDVLLKNSSLQTRNNLDIRGGTETVKYFVSLGNVWQNGLLKDFTTSKSEFNNNYYYQRYNFRSNLDVKASKTLDFRLDVTGRFGETNGPYITNPINTQNNVFEEMYSFQILPPYAYPLTNPNGSYPYSPSYTQEGNMGRSRYGKSSVIGRLAQLGYNRNFTNDLNIVVGGTQKLSMLTKGLSAKGTLAYASTLSNNRNLNRSGGEVPSYFYNPQTGTYKQNPDYQNFRLEKLNVSYTIANPTTRTTNIQGMLNYDRTFDKKHHLYGLALYNTTTRIDRASVPANIPTNFKGATLRMGYDFKSKYLLELVASRNGSDRFASAQRFGLFPAASAGWNIGEEDFFKTALPFIDLFKIRGSYGLVGSDVVAGNQYLYEQVWNRSPFPTSTGIYQYSFGETHNNYVGIREGTLGNNNVTWEKEKKMNIGTDINMFKGKLALTVDYFNNFRYDQLIPRRSISNVIGIGLPRENLGEVRNKGWDGQLSYRNAYKKLKYSVTGNFSFAKNRVINSDEATPAFPWLSTTGKPIGQPLGFTWIGFYADANDVLKSAVPAAGASPGDLKYKDLNGDMIIDEFDQGVIGKPNLPTSSAGLNFTLAYKGFDISTLLQSSFGYSFRIIAEGIEPFVSNLQPVHLGRWTPETASSATFHRLTTSASSINSSRSFSSDFWLIDAAYVRLKSVDLGYQIPVKLIERLKMSNVRVYVSGYNLLTFNNYDKYQQDAEVATASLGGAYPNSRVFNFGLQAGF